MNYKLDAQIGYCVLFLCCIVSTTISYRNRKKFRQLRWLYVYPLASLLSATATYATSFMELSIDVNLLTACFGTNVFILIEFVIIYNCLLKMIHLKAMKVIMYIFAVIYLTMTAYSWFISPGILKFPKHLFIYQSTFILIPTIHYLIEMIKGDKPVDPNKNPNFWLSIGLIIFFGCTLPTYSLVDYLMNDIGTIDSWIYSLTYYFYGIMFLMITRAFLCPPEQPQKEKPTVSAANAKSDLC